MIIGDGIMLGAGGETASIFVTGLSEADTVTATNGSKTLTGKWDSGKNGFLIKPISNFGTWTVTATYASGLTAIKIVEVDTAEEYRILMSFIDKYTVLLLHMDDDTFADSSQYGQIVTNNGCSASVDVGKFNGSLQRTKTTSTYLNVAYADSLQIGDELTVDCWLRLGTDSSSNCNLWGNPNRSGVFSTGFNFTISDGRIDFRYGNGSKEVENRLINYILDNDFHHYAFVKQGDTFYSFIDGVLQDTRTISGIVTASRDFIIGKARDVSYSFDGYLDELRVSNVARWTSDFTPPTHPY